MLELCIHSVVVAVLLAVVVLVSPDRMDSLLRDNAERLSGRRATPAILVSLILQGVNLMRLALLAAAALYVVTALYWSRLRNEATKSTDRGRQRDLPVDLLALLPLFAISTALRLGNITSSFWWDELSTMLRVVRRGVPTIIVFSADANNHVLNSLLVLGMSKMSGGRPSGPCAFPRSCQA